MQKPKIAIIGAGNVGATTAHLLAIKNLCDIVLLDVEEGIAKGKALDIMQSAPLEKFDIAIEGTSNYEDTKDSDIVIITAGIARKLGMSRDELLTINAKIVKDVAQKAAKYSMNAVMIVVTNPLDAMTHAVATSSNFPINKVIGMGSSLDSARFAAFIAEELGIPAKNVKAIVIGSHSDLMVPLPEHSTANGNQISKILPREKIEKLMERTRNGGKEIIELIKTSSASYGPASSIALMAKSILLDKKSLIPCCTYCDKEYDASGCFIGVPAILGKNGVEKIVELIMSSKEKDAFRKSVEHVKGLVEKTKNIMQGKD